MAGTVTVSAKSRSVESGFTLLAIGIGLALRLRLAWMTFLNPDEALHYFLSHQPSLKLACQASLTTAHPPLMIIFLHFWARLGSSEIFLRLPFVIAGTLFCWVMFIWVACITSRRAAWFAFALCLFSPSLISLSAEIRQYAFLLLFCVCCLYLLERAFATNSANSMGFSAVALWLALLSHYSALIFALSAGIYAIVRIFQNSFRRSLITAWAGGQIVALAICAYLFESQISKLRQSGIPSEIAATWLRSSIFQHGKDHLLIFAGSRTERLFRYIFSHGTIGVIGLAFFAVGIIAIVSARGNASKLREHRILALLFVLPFVITLGAAIAGVYPYGGTRHDVLLGIFAIPAIAIGLDWLPLGQSELLTKWLKPALLVCALVICNIFPSPSGPYIRPRNQRRELMQGAIASLRSLPLDSVIFTDDQGSMVLNYYLCGEHMTLPFSSQKKWLLMLHCGEDRVLVVTGTQTGFDRVQLPSLLAITLQNVKPVDTLYLFQSGWIDDKEQEWLLELRRLGGDPQNFGPNILICRLQRPQTPSSTAH